MVYHFESNSNLVENSNGYNFSGFSEGLDDGKLEGLFDFILLGSYYWIVLGSLVVDQVGTSVGYSESFKYGNIYGTLVGFYMGGEGRLYLVVKF